MISSEKAFDMLPYVADIYEKLNLDAFINDNTVKASGKNKKEMDKLQKQLGMKMIMYIIKNSSKIKDEVFNIVAIFNNISPEEAKQQNFLTTLQEFKCIFSNKELSDFFKQAMQ